MSIEAVKARVITSSSKKGGVGESFVATSVAYGLVKQDAKVLLVDLDAQGQDSVLLGLVQEAGVLFGDMMSHWGPAGPGREVTDG